MKTNKIIAAASGVFLAMALTLPVTSAAAPAGAELLQSKCSACHVKTDDGFSRIDSQRKTPEGWLMTIARMQISHGLKITDEERRVIVKHLADTQGLAPSETEDARYILERRLNTKEVHKSEDFGEMCARCHSGARTVLQRRTAEEWEHLMHYHVGEFVTLEYQDGSRDRDWFNLALDETVPYLAEHYPLVSDAWSQWQQQPPQQVAGDWSVSGHMSGHGDFAGTMKVTEAAGADLYQVSFDGQWANGDALSGQGQAVVYTGYEWRANLDLDGAAMQQVFALQDDQMQGRMFQRDQDEVGADVVAAREGDGAAARILSLQPAYLKAGQEAELRIVGANLDGEVSLPAGLTLLDTVSSSSSQIIVKVRADQDAHGLHAVAVGGADGGELAVYQRIDQVKVLPEFAVARLGGGEALTPVVQASFDAEAWDAGPDGKLGTDDDLRIGIVPAKWSVEPFDADVAARQDVKFAGTMDSATGVFTPAGAGPNPDRDLMTNNTGNLKVVAEVDADGGPVKGDGQLIVTVQRWNNPPIR